MKLLHTTSLLLQSLFWLHMAERDAKLDTRHVEADLRSAADFWEMWLLETWPQQPA